LGFLLFFASRKLQLTTETQRAQSLITKTRKLEGTKNIVFISHRALKDLRVIKYKCNG